MPLEGVRMQGVITVHRASCSQRQAVTMLSRAVPSPGALCCTLSPVHCLTPPALFMRRCPQVGIVVTQLPFCNQVAISDFTDKEDLINVAMASAHVPLFLDWKLAKPCRGVQCVDGSFPDFFTNENCDMLKCGGNTVMFDYFHVSKPHVSSLAHTSCTGPCNQQINVIGCEQMRALLPISSAHQLTVFVCAVVCRM
eukprot:GHRQ01014181.1.p2 GENE.GHRQ01014181.1~~GHRQ01014181.1.p2  ORF type:complete len:196 (-),score=48.30 GHRQ01014181.1:387-974(-)